MSNETTTIEANTAECQSALKRLVMRFLPFRKKEKKEPEIYKFLVSQRALEEKIFQAYPLWCEFEYMGVTCKVTRHQRYVRGFVSPGFYQPATKSQVYCGYVDKKGEIHNVSFRLDELEALLDA